MNGNIHRLLLFGLLALAGLNGTLSAQVQFEKLAPRDVHKGQFFGEGIAVSGDTAVLVGAGFNGTACVYERSGGSWKLVQELSGPPSPPESSFGRTVAIDGDWIALAGDEVRLFRREGKTWVLAQTLGLGASVDIDSTTLVAGWAGSNSVQVYELIEGTWRLSDSLSSSVPNELFGRAVAVDGDWILVGAPMVYWVFPVNYGQGYLYRREVGSSGASKWTLVKTFKGAV